MSKMSKKKEETRLRRHLKIRKRLSGTAERPRLVVFRSLAQIYAQVINDDTSKVLASASDMKMKGKATKTERAKQVGIEVAKIAQEKKIDKVVFDRNGYKYHGRVKALADGAREGGLQF
jgi:large subunit ribosomal protein L18